MLYRCIVKPILFLFPADSIHTLFLRTGHFLGAYSPLRVLVRALWRYDNPCLEQSVEGLLFKNPIGLSAGFDYNADLVNILPSVGFGFHTIGTITRDPYDGNPRPMLGRLPKSRALLVNKGFKNAGIATVLPLIPAKDGRALRGLSIGVTNKPYDSYSEMMSNLIEGFRLVKGVASFDYYELNISCPNLRNIKTLTEQLASPTGLLEALTRLQALGIDRPLFIKMPLERTHEQMTEFINTVVPFSFVTGLIVSNLAKDRTNPAFDEEEVAHAGTGNFSGKPVEKGANDLIRFIYREYHHRFVIIGVGGVFSAEDAYTKIRSGATLVALITGMVYRGPQLIGEINKGLVHLLARDGYTHISEAIGVDAKA